MITTFDIGGGADAKRFISRGNTKCFIVIRIFGYGYSKGFFSRKLDGIGGNNPSDTNVFRNMITTFDIGGGADAKRFTLAGNKLTFKATAFKARNNTYRVNLIYYLFLK
jgi:hypothetical protein